MVSPDEPCCLSAALDYAKRGFSVVVLHGVVNGRCTCGNNDCSSPGKHPIGGWRDAQTKRATADELKGAFAQHPNANVGIATGAISNVLVVDADGKEGREEIAKILAKPPDVPTVFTGNGLHLYGRHSGGSLKNFVKARPGIDGRADGGYVVAPPSRHISGREYRWERPLRDPMPELPTELLDLFKSTENAAAPRTLQHRAKGLASEVLAYSARRAPENLKKYAQSALIDECHTVAAAPIGQQEITLAGASFKIGRYVGAGLLEFGAARDALVEAGLRMVNSPQRSPWTRVEIVAKVEAKFRDGTKSPKWGSHPRGEGDDQSPPIDIFGDAELTGRPEFPVEALPWALQDFVVDRAERLGVEPAMIAMPALAACAATLDDKHVIQVRRHDDQFTESARLWVMIVEQPGGKKTPAIEAALSPFREIEDAWHAEDQPKHALYELAHDEYCEDRKRYLRANGEKRLEQLFSAQSPEEPAKPPLRRLMITDTTVEALARILADNPAGVLGHFDELAQLIGSFDAYRGVKASGRDRAIWLQLYNGGSQQTDRVGSGNLRVPNWSACVVGGIQPERLRKIVPDLTDDGFLQRFIPVFGSGPSRGIDRPANVEADQRYRDVLANVVALRDRLPVRVAFSPEAHEARERVMDYVEALLTLPELPGALKNHLNKCEALFARLALTIHVVEWALFPARLPETIQGATAERAEALMRKYLLPNLLRFYGEFYGRDEHAQLAHWIAGHILAHRLPVISERDIYRARHVLRDDKEALSRAMSRLEIAGWVVAMNGEGGKKTTQWWVDPRVHELFAERAVEEKRRRAEERERIREAAEKVHRAA